MRNGNSYCKGRVKGWTSSSYRTYEEWKQTSSLVSFRSFLRVLTVPMRNGNPFPCKLLSLCPNTFLPYLWGMETSYSRQPSESPSLRSYRTYEEWKPSTWVSTSVLSMFKFLPYLWGMETTLRWHRPPRACHGFLPYLWGMETFFQYQATFPDLVLTVPMRNGNLKAKKEG